MDFEAILKYFRISMPKKYLDEEEYKKLVNSALGFRVCADDLIFINPTMVFQFKAAEHGFVGSRWSLHDGTCFKLDKQNNMVAKKAKVHRRSFLKICSLKFCDIWQNFYFNHILNNENFKMKLNRQFL